MLWLKRFLVFVLVIALFIGGMLFTTENTTAVAISIGGYVLPELPLGEWVILSFAVGVILGLVVSLWTIGRLKTQQMKLKRQLSAS